MVHIMMHSFETHSHLHISKFQKLNLNMSILTILRFFFILLFSVILFTAHVSNSVVAKIMRGNETDHEALLAIKSHISADPHSLLASWNNSLSICDWYGVICGRRHRRVVSLELVSSDLAGTLSPFIGNLSFLRNLTLSNNSFRGIIPHQVSKLSRLRFLQLTNNSFQGEIPANLSRCLQLQILHIGSNNLEGRMPHMLASLPNLMFLRLYENNLSGGLDDIGLGNMSTSLQIVNLDDNKIQGSIPQEIGRSSNNLLVLSLASNLLSGTIPMSLFNHSSLILLDLSSNQIEGNLPQDLGLRLPHLEFLSLINNSLTGKLPTSFSNLSKIELLELGFNNFTGRFYLNGNNLPSLSHLFVQDAFYLGLGEVRDLSFVDTLTNCTYLKVLYLGGNAFVGTFPTSILNFSTTLTIIGLFNNQIYGHIPSGLGKFINLQILDIANNHLTSSIPVDMGKMERLELLYMSYNNFSAEIPSSLGNLTMLSTLHLDHNNLEGSLPTSLGNCRNLGNISFASNKLSGFLPAELFRASTIFSIDISQNNFKGPLPIEISKLEQLVSLDVSHNRFSSEIPTTLGACTSLTSLDLSGNSFNGSIPESLSPLKSIQYLDLSCNNISGPIPTYLSTWPYLSSLNLSFNDLVGEVPVDGVFAKTSAVSIAGNNKLCGGKHQLHLPKCPVKSESKKGSLYLATIIVIVVACVIAVITLIALCFYLICASWKKNNTPSGLEDLNPLLEVSYQMLSRATNGFSPSNLLGVGAFGSVYKGILHQEDKEKVVAVKVLNLQHKGAGKSFFAECNALKNIRHRNLVGIITACSSIDSLRNEFKALVFEFMPRGSLESWLHSPNHATNENSDDDKSFSLTLFQRLSIAIDVGSALEYLHIGCGRSIIHCDLKPSNILLDDDMTAHVGDFGLAKFIPTTLSSDTLHQSSSTQVRGAVGYAAPEYGLGSKVSPEGDIYSFGIVILEMMTSKKPTDPMFNNGLNLHDFGKSALPDRVMEIIDKKMIGGEILVPARSGSDIKKMECIKSLIKIGVECSVQPPQERMKMSNAVNDLKSARQNLLPGRA